MSTVAPIPAEKLKDAERWLKQNAGAQYLLAFKIGVETGLRISDVLALKVSDIDTTRCVITCVESKGTKARQARAERKVLAQVKSELIAKYPERALALYVTKDSDVLELVPARMRASVTKRIAAARQAVTKKTRTCKISHATAKIISQYARANPTAVQLFARSTLKNSSRARGMSGTLTRQAVWAVLSRLTDALKSVTRIACHSLRKTYARGLYFASGRDIALVMSVIGHSSVAITLRYIAVDDDDVSTATASYLETL